MEEFNSKYKNGKIYKLEKDGLTYIGSTIQPLNRRFSKHKTEYKSNKKNKCSSKRLFEIGENVIITLIEDYPCNNNKELQKRERYYIENNECVNFNIPNRTIKEWRVENKEDMKLKDKLYREKNKERYKITDSIKYERTKIKKQEKITCECGSIIARSQKTEHLKTKKHKNLVNSNL